MNIDKHFDPTDDLEKELLQELDDIARQLNGKITYSAYGNSTVSYTHLRAHETQ